MDDKKIRAFLTIIQLGSLRRAAQELNYTQSGLTQMMKHLEQEVGCRLKIGEQVLGALGHRDAAVAAPRE